MGIDWGVKIMIEGIIASQITEHSYVITSGNIRGGQVISNAYVSYSINFGTTILKSGSIRTTNGVVTLTSTEIADFNAAMGIAGGTFTVINSTSADMSSVVLSLTFSTDGYGSTTKSCTAINDPMNDVKNGYLEIP